MDPVRRPDSPGAAFQHQDSVVPSGDEGPAELGREVLHLASCGSCPNCAAPGAVSVALIMKRRGGWRIWMPWLQCVRAGAVIGDARFLERDGVDVRASTTEAPAWIRLAARKRLLTLEARPTTEYLTCQRRLKMNPLAPRRFPVNVATGSVLTSQRHRHRVRKNGPLVTQPTRRQWRRRPMQPAEALRAYRSAPPQCVVHKHVAGAAPFNGHRSRDL
jgi:hypothetical protein